MNNNYPVEALLRPPIELWSVLCAYGTATIAIMAPWSLMMTPAVGYGTATLLFLFGSIRAKDAFYVLRYQRNMRKLPEYSLTPDQLPVSYRRLFLEMEHVPSDFLAVLLTYTNEIGQHNI